MMVASTPLMKLQKSHNHSYMDMESSVSNMPYPVRRHNSERIESHTFLNAQGNAIRNFEGQNNRPSPPDYSEVNGDGDCATRAHASGCVRDRSSSDRTSSDSGSPLEVDENPDRVNVIQPTNLQYFSGSRSPSGLSPPLKRMASTGSSNSYQKVQETISNWPISSTATVSPMENHFSDLRHSKGQNAIHDREPRRSEYTYSKHSQYKFSMSLDDGQFSNGVHAEEDDDARSRSPLNNVHHVKRPSSTSHPINGSSGRSLSTSSQKTPSKNSSQMNVFEDDDDDSWKICSVCGDKATGYHFNALTCEGCKGFFRRSMKNGKNFTCPYSGNCTITKSNRRQCQACRLQKCLRIGMKKECIMSHTEIQLKKNLMLNNRIKRSILEWKPLDYSSERKELVTLISESHTQTNVAPDIREEDGMLTIRSRDPTISPASSTNSGFSELINQMTQDIVATAPGPSNPSKSHLRHFSAIMEFSIKEIIKFCKKIPDFTKLSLKDQITLLKSGCTEILFIKANYTYDREQNALMCGPGKYYTRESFILDRDGLENKTLVEEVQHRISVALQSYTENKYNNRVRFPKIMAYLTKLRTLNWHISKTLDRIQSSDDSDDIKPLVFECLPNV